jgi:hypothetical protein
MSTRWQYQTLEIKPKTFGGFDAAKVQEQLARQGALGWELVQAVTSGQMYPMLLLFKREA